MKIEATEEGYTLTDFSSRSIVFYQSSRCIYLLTDKGEVISLSPTGRIHKMRVFCNAVKIEGRWISLNKVLSMVFFGDLTDSEGLEIRHKNGRQDDLRRRNIQIIIQSKSNVLMNFYGRRLTTFIRIHG